MSEAALKLLEQVLALPRTDQEVISARLLESLDGLPEVPGEEVSEEEARQSWHAEIIARLERYDRGETKAIPADEVIAELRARTQDRRK